MGAAPAAAPRPLTDAVPGRAVPGGGEALPTIPMALVRANAAHAGSRPGNGDSRRCQADPLPPDTVYQYGKGRFAYATKRWRKVSRVSLIS